MTRKREARGCDFNGAHVVVTGASRGIGEALARELAQRGSRVTVVARSRDRLDSLAEEIGGTAVPADLSDTDQVSRLVETIEDDVGPIDILFNGAARLVVDPPERRSTAEELASSLTLNTFAPLELSRQMVPRMLARGGGTIVNVSSFGAISAIPTLATYGATKAAVGHFTAALHRELRHTPVRAVLVLFGQVETDLLADAHAHSAIAVAASDRIGKTGFMPNLSPEEAARQVADGLASGRPSVVVPRRLAGLHHLREFPSRLNDLVLLGLRP